MIRSVLMILALLALAAIAVAGILRARRGKEQGVSPCGDDCSECDVRGSCYLE